MREDAVEMGFAPLPNESGFYEWDLDGYVVSTDRRRLDLATIERFLSRESYWGRGLSRDAIVRSINGSLAFGVYDGACQVAFCRVITDLARVAYLLDVYVDAAHRGRQIGTQLSAIVRTHPDLATVKRWLLVTPDAAGVYSRTGWSTAAEPGQIMEIVGDDPARADLRRLFPSRRTG